MRLLAWLTFVNHACILKRVNIYEVARPMELIDARTAAKKRDVSRQAVYKAMDTGLLNDYRTGNHRLVIVDDAFRRWLNAEKADGGDSEASS